MRDQMIKHDWKLDERAASSPGSHPVRGCSRSVREPDRTPSSSATTAWTSSRPTSRPRWSSAARRRASRLRSRTSWTSGFPDGSFDAVWTINCLLHVPTDTLPAALAEIARVLRPDGLLFLGVYSTEPPSEGVNEDDNHDPKRFFAFRPDEVMLAPSANGSRSSTSTRSISGRRPATGRSASSRSPPVSDDREPPPASSHRRRWCARTV